MIAAGTDNREFFATTIQQIEQTPEFTRLTFLSQHGCTIVVMTPSAFTALARLIVEGPLPLVH